jgi:hypothetical protein
MAEAIQSFRCLDGTIVADKAEALRRDGAMLAASLLDAGAAPATREKKVEAIREELLRLRVQLTELFEDTIATAIGEDEEPKVRRIK